MPNNNNRINFQVGYNVDQASVNAVKKSLQDLQNIKFKDFNGPKQDLDDIKQKASQVEAALNKAFNVNLNSLNTQSFNAELQKAGLSIDKIYTSFSKAGAQGQVAFSRMASEVLTTNMQLKQTNSLVSQMGETMANTVKWGIASSVMNNFTNSVRQAFDYVKALDSSLNDIRIVTKQSSDQMANFAVQANNSAQALGRSTMDYTKAALTFYQQGLDEASVQARTESVLKAQNITGAGQEMADYLTAVWNGYKVANEEAELYVDKLAAVADSSASNMSQLAIAMSKVASSANLLGVPVDNLNAQIATIVATTRQAPESVGNALKTIYSRINDIATGADDAQISLGNYSAKMAQVGISVLDANGRLRDTGDVIDEIGGKWETLSHEQQIYLARTMAGQRQYNNLLALFENWGKYSDLVNVSMEAQGATAQKNAIYMESLSAKMEQLGAAGEKVKAALIDEDDLKGLVEFGTGAVNLFGNLIQSIGGGKGALLTFGSIFTQVFSGTISKQINNAVINFQNYKHNLNEISEAERRVAQEGENSFNRGQLKLYINDLKELQNSWRGLSNQQKQEQQDRASRIADLRAQAAVLRENQSQAQKFAEALTGSHKDIAGSGSKNLQTIVNNIKQNIQEADSAAEAFFTHLANDTVEDQPLERLAETVGKLVRSLGNAATSQQRQLAQNLDNLARSGRQAELDLDQLDNQLTELFNTAKNNSNNLELVIKTNGTKQQLGQISTEIKKLKGDFNQVNNAGTQALDVKSLVNFTAGLGQLASVANNVVNIFKIWQDQNLSSGQKILQTFTNLSMTTGMLYSGLKNVKEGWDSVSKLIINTAGKIIASRTANAIAATSQASAVGAAAAANTVQAGTAGVATTANLTLASSFATIVAAAAPFIAIGAAVGLAIYAVYKEWNRQSEAAQKAAQVAQKAKETYDDLKSTYEDLKSSLEDYNSAQEAIAEMTKGTQEWRDAIRESNDAVLDLIQAYPELASEVQNVNGQLVISAQAQQEAIQKAAAAVDNARLASIATASDSRDASLRANARESGRFAGQISYSGQFIQATTDQIMNLVEAYSTATDRSVQALAEQTGMSEQLVSSILTEVDNMDQLVAQLQNNTEATKLSYEAMASERLQGNKVYEGLDDLGKQVAQAIAGQDLMAGTDINQFLTTDDSFKQLSKFSSASEDYMQDILDRFRKAMGDATIDWASNAAQGFGGKQLHFMIDGQELQYTKEQVAATIAASEALQDLTGSVEKARDVLNDIGDISNQSNSTALKDFIGNKGFGNLTSGQLNELDPFSTQMETFFKEHAEELGYETGEEFQDAFVKAQQAALKDWDLLGADSLRPVQDTIREFFKGKDFSLQTAQNISTALDTAFKQVGNKGLESLTNLFDDSIQDIDQIVKAIASADITTPKGLQELTEQLQKIGDGSFVASEEWQNFVNQVSQTQFENPLDNIFERQENIEKITKGLSKNGIVSEEDYNTLLQINPQIDAMFTRVAGGYQLIESKGSLMELLVGGTNGYFEAANQFDQLKNSAENLAQSFGQDFQAGLLSQSSIPNAIQKSIESIDSQQNSEQLWSALGFNEDYINAQAQKYGSLLSEITERQRRGLDTTQQQSQLAQLDLELRNFLSTVFTAPDLFQGMSDSLREAGALGLQTLSQLNDKLVAGEITGQQFAMALQKVSQTEISSYGIDVNQYEDYIDLLQSSNKELAQNQYLARQVAKSNMRISKGMDDLIANWDDWNSAISEFIKSGGDINTIADDWNQLKDSIVNLLDMDPEAIDLLGPDFVAKHWDKIQAVRDGVEGAYQELKAITGQQLLVNITGATDFSQVDSEIQQLHNNIASLDANIQVGAVLDSGPMLAAMQQIVDAAHMTSQQAQAYFSQMGYDVEVQAKPGQTHQATQTNQEYVPPKYRMTPYPFNLGPFGGSGTLLLPEVVSPGHYISAGVGTKQSYEPDTFAVKTATKKAGSSGGNITRRKAGSSPRSSGRGGGGGGKGSTPKAATQAKVSTTKIETTAKTPSINPYEQEQKSYQRQSKILDKLQDQQKKLVNKDRLKNLEEQNRTLKEQEKILNRELDISHDEAYENSTADYARRLRQKFRDALSFDEDGQISDINKIQQISAETYNAAAKAAADAFEKQKEAYNNYILNTWNAYGTQENQELHKLEKEAWDQRLKDSEQNSKKAIKDAEEEYKTREDLINSYTKAWEADQKRLEQIQQIQEQIIENQIAASKIRVDLSIDAGDFEREWLEFENKFIKKLDKDDFLGNAKANLKELMSYFDAQQIQQTANQIENIKKEITTMQTGGTSSIYGNNLAQAQEDLEQYMKQQMDDLKDIQDLVDDIKDNYLDALDDAKDKMDDQINQYERVNDLVEHNMKLTQMLYGDKVYNTMEKYYDYQKDNNQNILNNLRAEQLYWQTLLNQQTQGSDAWKQIKENLDDVTDNLNSKLEDMIDNLASQFENRVSGIIDRLNNALTGGRGLDYLDEQWDYINNYDDNFLDTFETKTGIQEVERLYQSQIENLAGSPKSQQKLNKLMNDQLKLLREKDHLTEYDLERAKASLEVEKARLALEEARDRKTKMRLRRDSQGNYTYQYVADEQKLGDLQAALADAQANLYQTDKDHYRQNLNTLYDTYKQYIEKMRDLTAEYNATQDEEERKRISNRIELLKKSTADIMEGLTEDNSYLLNYLNGSFFGGMGTDTSALTMEEQMEIMKENIPYMQSNIQDLADTIVGEGGILPATTDMVKQLNDATIQYDQNVEQILASAGTNLQTISNVTDALGNSLDKNILQVQSLTGYYTDLIDKSVEAITKIQEVLNTTQGALNSFISQDTVDNLAEAYNLAQLLNGIGTQINGQYLDKNKNTLLNQKNGVFIDDQLVDWNLNTNMTNQQYQDYLKKMSNTDSLLVSSKVLDTISNLDIGKLQQQDLKTIVGTIQAITSNINSIAGQGIDSIMSNASGYIGNINNVEQLDQNVHIEANFPNVTHHTQIEQAFENLVNMASMKASRYKD